MSNMKPKEPIPKFKTIQEEAEFWDTHNTADYADQMVPVRAKIARRLTGLVQVRMDDRMISDLEAKARAKGVGASTLVRIWVKERLQSGA